MNGGLLRYGIPDFKLDKQVLDRRINLMVEEGVKFQTNVNVGENLSIEQLKEDFDAVCCVEVQPCRAIADTRKKFERCSLCDGFSYTTKSQVGGKK